MKRTLYFGLCRYLFLIVVAVFCFSPLILAADNVYSDGERLMSSGKYEEAANWYVDLINKDPKNEKVVPGALIRLGDVCEKMLEQINTKAEKVCFRSGGSSRGAKCMQDYAEKLNTVYGPGSFAYSESLVIIQYTGAHYDRAANEFPKSGTAAEAAYLRLTKQMVGHPDQVLPKIQDYMKRYKEGEWGRKGRLLWARINEDIWWVHRKWSWVLYNWTISPEELIIKAEPYRQEALRAFEDLMKKDGGTEEGRVAKKEYELLKDYKDDGKLYGIVNESDVEGGKALHSH